VARARQRQVARAGQVETGDELSTEFPLALVVALASGAIWCLWHARSMDASTPDGAASRRRWILAGLALAGFAIGLGYLPSGDEPDAL
jgi:hypothetical protein